MKGFSLDTSRRPVEDLFIYGKNYIASVRKSTMTDDPDGPTRRLDDLEPAFDGASTEERVFDFLIQHAGPASAPEVARAIDCSKDTARKYLEWFGELGVARTYEGRPTTYERNEEYFEWRYVSRLAESHTPEELRANVVDLRDRVETFRERYDAEDPQSVDLLEATRELDADVEEVWDDLSTWAGLLDEIRLHDRARRRRANRTEART